jgi:cytochrome b pre-mRNA-processing protein 3
MVMWPFAHSRAGNRVRNQAQGLVQAVQAAARQPALYGPGRTPDTLEGRFDLMALFAALAMIRLRADPGAQDLAQSFTDTLFRHFDAGLREAGVGDMAVAKRMRALAGEFYGRLEAYAGPIDASDETALAAAIVRNISDEPNFAAQLAKIVLTTAQRQAAEPVDALLSPQAWAAATA